MGNVLDKIIETTRAEVVRRKAEAPLSVLEATARAQLPPRGFGSLERSSRQRCTHLMAELTLISNKSAASRRDAPASTVPITRSRRSPEYDCGIVGPPKANQCR